MAGTPQSRAAPRSAREHRARAPRTPRPARAGPYPALPRPRVEAARGRLPELCGSLRECESGGPGPLLRRQLGAAQRGLRLGGAVPGGPRSAARLGPSPPPQRCTAAVRVGAAMNSAGEARRARARGRCRPAGCPSPLANQRGPPGHPIPTAGTAPAHARIRPHRAAGGRPHILELDSAPPTPTSSARTRFLRAAPPRQRPAAPAPPRPARGRPGPFRTPGPRLPTAWRSHRHSPWVPRAHCTQAADGMDAGRGGTVGGSVFWIFFFWSLGRGRGGRESCTSLMVAALLLHEHRMSSRP